MKECWKMFIAPDSYPNHVAIFCTWEDEKYFYGYLIGSKKLQEAVSIGISKAYKECWLDYIHGILFPKNVHYEKMECHYRLKGLRSLVERAHAKPNNHTTYSSDRYKIDTSIDRYKVDQSITMEQLRNRKNKTLIEEFHTLKQQLEIAEINNNRAAVQKIDIRLMELRKMLGYKAGVKVKRDQTQLLHYYKPFQGGGCTPK